MVKVNEVDYKKIKADFQKKWSIDKIRNMQIEEYTSINEKGKANSSFTYIIETELKNIWNIKWSTSLKFWIYKTKNQKEKSTKWILNTEWYEWYERYWKTKDEAFKKIRNLLVEIIDCVNNNKYDEIDNIDISHMFKWKVAYMYDNNDRILPIFDYTMLCTICYWNWNIPSNPYSTISIYDELLKNKWENNINNYNSQLINKFIEYKTEFNKNKELSSTFLLKYLYNYWWINTIDEHQKIIKDNWSVLWWVFNSEKNFWIEVVNKINELTTNWLDYFLILWKTNDGINILHVCEFDWIKAIEVVQKDKLQSFIPKYYRKDKSIKYYINIKKIKQVPISLLDLYLPITANIENLLHIQKYSIRQYFSWQLTFSFLRFNNRINSPLYDNFDSKKWNFENNQILKYADLVKKISRFSKIKKIIWIKFNNYYWISEKIWYIDLSNWAYNYNNWEIIKNNKQENIFHDYWINTLNCIVWKNWVWKSRIINAICNYFNDWQNFNINNNRWYVYEEDFEIFLEDTYWYVIKASNSNYIWKTIYREDWNLLWNLILNFSEMKNLYISNSANDSKKLENNTILYWWDEESSNFSSFEYLWVVNWNNFNIDSHYTNIQYILFYIFLNKDLYDLFTRTLKSIGLDYKFEFPKFSIRTWNKDINESLKSVNNIYELLKIIQNEKLSESFFERNSNREKVKSLISWYIKVTRFELEQKNQIYWTNEVQKPILKKINIEWFKKLFEELRFDEEYTKNNITKLQENLELYFWKEYHKHQSYEILNDFFFLLFKANLLNIDYFNDTKISIFWLSSWEQTIITHIAKLIFWIVKNNTKNINVFFDEPDITLHPEWQRKFINAITEVYWAFHTDNKIESKEITDPIKIIRYNNSWIPYNNSIIISTHSPIMLSDIPKENIMALEKNDKWDIGKINEDKLWKTFLNNLYELYWNPFFTNSFIWEFAIKKYREASWIIDITELEEIRNLIKTKIKDIESKELLEISKRLRSINITNYKNSKLFNDFLNIINKDSNIWNIENIIWDEIIINQLEKDIENKEEINLWIILDLFHEIIDNLLLEKINKWKK